MDEKRDIDLFFSLSYANYLVLPRSVLQSMPEDWQDRFVRLMDECSDLYGHLDWPDYEVRALARPREVVTYEECGECSGAGIVADRDCPECKGEGHVECDPRYEEPEEVGFRTDPIPHYDRTRTRIPPRGKEVWTPS